MAEHTTPNYAIPYPDVKGKVQIGPTDIQEIAERMEAVLSGSTTPVNEVGDIKGSTSIVAPPGWLLCDGSEVSQTTYAALYTVVKGKWGAAVAGKFRLPLAAGRMPIGSSGTHAFGSYGGEAAVTLTGPQSGIGVHSHDIRGYVLSPATASDATDNTVAYHGPPPADAEAAKWLSTVGNAGPTSASVAHENMPPYFVVNFFIKY